MKISKQVAEQAATQKKIITMQLLKGTDVPYSERTEEALIAALLYKPEIVTVVALLIDDDAWFMLRHATIWNAMTALAENGVAIDVVTLSEHLQNTPCAAGGSELFLVGGPAYFTQLLADNISHKNYREYVGIINEAHRRRCMLQTADELALAGRSYDVTAADAINRAYSQLDVLADRNRTFTTIEDGISAHVNKAENARNNPVAMGIPSGIANLDDKIDGFHRRRVYIVGARTHHGKTALLMTTALHAASKGARVGIFNVADGNTEDVISRLVGIESGVKSHEILMGRCDPQEYSRYFEASKKVASFPIYIESQPQMTLPELLVKARNIKYRFGLDLVCIDYAQEIGIDLSHPQAPTDRVNQLRYIATKMTELAGEKFLNVPIILAAQLNRAAVGRAPVNSDLKGSGAFEQVADVIILPYRESFNSNKIDLYVTKNRVTNRMGIIEAQINDISSKIEDIQW